MSSEAETPPGLEHFRCDCGDYESAVSPTAYLADLVDYVTGGEDGYGHVHDRYDDLSIDDLEETFYQPVGELVADPDAATETVRHVRIATESLLGHLEGWRTASDVPAPSETGEYRLAAYDALLSAFDVSREDLREAVYDETDREWLADALGLPEDHVTDLRLDPDASPGTEFDPTGPDDAAYPVSERNLEELFGLPALTESGEDGRTRTDPLRTIEEPYLRRWRRQYLRGAWTGEDHPEDPFPQWLRDDSPYGASIGATAELPAVDPDVISPDDVRPKPTPEPGGGGSGTSLPDPGVPEPTDEFEPPSDYVGRTGAFPERAAALALWEVRRRWMDDELEAIWRRTPAGPGSQTDVAGVLDDMLSAPQYRSRTGETPWYPDHPGQPPTVPSSPGTPAPGADPLAGKGFLEDFARLHTQLTGETESARDARDARAAGQYPTGDPDDEPAQAARTVVEEQLHLPQPAFVRLVDLLRTHYADGETLDEEEWWEVASILAGARKRSCFEAWAAEEASFDVVIDGRERQDLSVQLDRKRFWQARREPTEGEWSFRLDRHDPADPEADPEPYVDPERTSRSDLPDEPHGDAARELFEQRRETLADRRGAFTETYQRRRRELQSDFESFASTYRSELQSLRSQLPDDGEVPDQLAAQSPLDPALDVHYGSVSWPDPSWDWQRRFDWLREGLRLARERDRSGSSLTASERQHASDAEAKLEALDLAGPTFEELAQLRAQSKPLPPEEQGLTDDQLATAFARLPTGNPLDPVLTTVYDSVSGDAELQDVFDDQPPRWDPLFASIRRTLEERDAGSASGGSRPPALETLSLSTDEFETVLSLRRRARPAVDPDDPSEALVEEVIELLTSVWKRLEKYDASGGSGWIAEEEQAGVTDYWDAYKARLPQWRATGEQRSAWQQALYDRSTAPLVDPDLLEGVSDFEPPAHDRDGFDLMEDREATLGGEHARSLVYEVEQLRLAAEQNQQVPPDVARSKLDAALYRTVGLDFEALDAIGRRMAAGDDVGVLLSRVDVTPAGLTYLREIEDALGTKPVRVEEWESVAQILLRAWKHRQYGRWNREERARGVVLQPEQFSLPGEDAERSPPADDDPLRWRVEWSVRSGWEDVLESRTEQWEAVDEEIEEAVAAAEREALPILRDQLIERVAEPEPDASDEETAEWLSERLLIDVEMTPDRDTTRTSQAITSLQNLVESIDLSLADEGGLADLDLSLEDEYFDRRWRWLGTYAKWKAAMGVYLYPENVLLPTLRRRTTAKFDAVARSLSQTPDLSPAAASAAAQEYGEYVADVRSLHPIAGCMAPGPTVAPRADDEPAAVTYAIARATESDSYYLLAFDPESQYQAATPDPVDDTWPDNSTWTRIPVEALQAAEEVHGMASYDESIYVFATTTEQTGGDGGADAEVDGDGGSGGGSDGSSEKLQYVEYDLRADEWHKPREIELPEEIDHHAFTYTFDDGVEGAWPVLRAGLDARPELYVGLSGSSDVGSKRFGFLVEFDEAGEPPDVEAITGGTMSQTDLPRVVVEYDSDHRTVFYDEVVTVVDREAGTEVTQRYYRTFAQHDRATEVFVRPTEGDAFLYDFDPDTTDVVTPVDVSGNMLSPRATEPLSGGMFVSGTRDVHLTGFVTCNNTVSRPLERPSDYDEVVLGSHASVPRLLDVPVPPLDLGVSSKRALGPSIPREVDDDHPWRLVVDPAETDGTLEETATAQRERIDDVYADTAHSQHVYVEEASYFLPLLIARQLTSAGEFEAALEWFQCIFDHTRDGPEERAIWTPLAPNGGRQRGPPTPRGGWLLDPIDPHGLAEARATGQTKWGQAYTQFTLFSLARCLSDYGDAQFATDTAETVALATDLYEQSLDVLELGPLSPGIDHCGDLLDRLEAALDRHVFDPEVWTDDPDLTRAGARSRADRIGRVVEEIDAYVDREEAVAEITDALADDGLVAALDVANEWADRETEQRRYEDRIPDWLEDLGDVLLPRPAIESRLVDVATAVDRMQPAAALAGGGGGGGGGRGAGGGGPGSGGAATVEVTGPDWIDDEVASSVSATNLDAAGVVEPAGGAAVDWDAGDEEPPRMVIPTSAEAPGEAASGDGQRDDAVSAAAIDSGTLDLLEANEHRFCIPENPLLDALRRTAEVNLEKIRAGRNIAGMKRELDPYASDVSVESATPTPGGGAAGGAGVGSQPTDYRYETLIARAKDLAEQARQFESQFLRSIEKGASEREKLKRARQKVDIAEERVSLQDVRMERARSKVELARLKREKAVLKRDRYKQWIENPLVQKEQEAIDKLQQAVTLQRTAADFLIAATAAHGVAAVSHGVAAGFRFAGPKQGAAWSSVAAAASSVAAGLSTTASVLTTDASALSTRAQIKQIRARKQRRKRQWRLKRDVAKKNVEIGDQQVTVADRTVDVVAQEREVARLRADHAEDLVNFHETKFTSRELYDWIADVLQGVYRYFLQQAASVARMAERQLAFERQSLPREFVDSDYWDAPTEGQTAVPAAGETGSGDGDDADRRGLTGSAQLLQDIYELDQHQFRTDERRLEVEKTISVAEQDPMALQEFRETGVLSIATELADFDADHPGHFHRMIESVDVTIVALTPPKAGINATLRNSGTSRIVVGDTLFQERRIDRDPEEIVLNRARERESRNEVRFRQDDRDRLRPFEHSGVATDWELRMHKAANDMDYDTIADVQLTINYTALDSYDRRKQVVSELDPERTVERAYSFHDDFSDAWYGLTNAPAGSSSTTVEFETSREDFPTNLRDLSLSSARLYAVVSGPDRAAQREDLKDLKVRVAPADGSETKGRATNGTVDVGSLDADDPSQRWELTVTPTGTGDPFADGTIEDVLLLVSAEGTAPSWSA